MWTLLIVSLFAAVAVAEEIKYSDPNTLVYKNDNEGDLKFTYKTFLRGDENYQTAYLHGMIEINDNKQFDSVQDLEWKDRAWADTDQVRIGMIWLIPGQERQYREQLRFNYLVDGAALDDTVQNALDFNDTGATYTRERIFSFLMLPRDSDKLDTSKRNEVVILSSSMDKATKQIKIEFERPLDPSYDRAFFLEPEGDYKIYLVWGVFETDADTKKSRVKGIRGLLEKEGRDEAFNEGEKWVLNKPPGWDELQQKLTDYNPNASGASKLSLRAFLSCSLLAIFSMSEFF